jgi:hypothetical protein
MDRAMAMIRSVLGPEEAGTSLQSTENRTFPSLRRSMEIFLAFSLAP